MRRVLCCSDQDSLPNLAACPGTLDAWLRTCEFCPRCHHPPHAQSSSTSNQRLSAIPYTYSSHGRSRSTIALLIGVRRRQPVHSYCFAAVAPPSSLIAPIFLHLSISGFWALCRLSTQPPQAESLIKAFAGAAHARHQTSASEHPAHRPAHHEAPIRTCLPSRSLGLWPGSERSADMRCKLPSC